MKPLLPKPLLIATRGKLVAALGSGLLVLVVVGVGIQAVDRTEAAQGWVDHALRVRWHVRNLTESLLLAQVAQAAHLAIGDAYPAGDVRTLRESTSRDMAALLELTADNPSQHERVLELGPLLERNVAEVDESIRLAQAGDRAATLAFAKKILDRVEFKRLEDGLNGLRAAEDAVIAERRDTTEERTQASRVLLLVGGTLAFLLTTVVILRVRKSVVELERANAAIVASERIVALRTLQLERSVKELDQFAYVASHDLKAPLRAIANLAQWIEADAGDRLEPEGREHLRLMVSRVARMDALVDGVLAYARVGRTPLVVEAIAMKTFMPELIESLGPQADTTITIETPMPTVSAPRMPFQQIWMNLIGNAIKHGRPRDGHIRVGVRTAKEAAAGRSPADGEMVFYVADDGPGIDPRFHDRIFALFQKLDARDRVEGAGIGLAVVKKLVVQQGGRVWVESAPGAGATFFFTYPPGQALHA